MEKWADYLISKVSYDRNHLIKSAIRHQDTEKGITLGTATDRLTIASDIKNGLTYTTLYSSENSWQKGHKIETYSIDGNPYLRIDGNRVNLDFLGDLPESPVAEEPEPEPKQEPTPKPEPQNPRGSLPKESAEELPQELDLAPESVTEELPKPEPQSPRGSLPKESAEELPQELDLAPEPVTDEPTPEPEDEATPEQLEYLEKINDQINELEEIVESQSIESQPEPKVTPEQISRLELLEDQIDELETVISNNAKNQPSKDDSTSSKNKKSDTNEKKSRLSPEESAQSEDVPEAYCVKCRTKTKISEPEKTVMKNGRPALKGRCSVCDCKVFRIVKMK